MQFHWNQLTQRTTRELRSDSWGGFNRVTLARDVQLRAKGHVGLVLALDDGCQSASGLHTPDCTADAEWHVGSEARREVPRRVSNDPLDDDIDRQSDRIKSRPGGATRCPTRLAARRRSLNRELATLRGRELLEFAEPAFQRRDSGSAVFAGVAVRIPPGAPIHASLISWD